jgi:cystathionine gamma-lyase
VSKSPRPYSGRSTLAVHAGPGPDPATGAAMTPIYATSTFIQPEPGVTTGWEYARSGNPTRAAFEQALAQVEGGAAGFAFASGLAAEATILDLLAHGSHIIASQDLYGGSWRLFHRVRKQSANLSVSHIDVNDPAALKAALQPNTKMIWIETPGNPTLSIVNLESAAAFAKQHGLISVVDNTFASPAVQQPLAHGADIVVHSVTKYIGGHSDLVAGAVVIGHDRPELVERMGFLQNAVGAVLDPFQAFLARRGLMTLEIRAERHAANALKVARFLESHGKVERVFYPALPSHPGHNVAMKQMSSGGGMVTLTTKGDQDFTVRFLKKLSIFGLAESLGGVESLVGYPWMMSHASVPEEQRREMGVTPNLVRLSVGIEDADDLIADLETALAV